MSNDKYLIQDDINNNSTIFDNQVEERNKNYYWETEERNGIRYNTLNYKNRINVTKSTTGRGDQSGGGEGDKTSCGDICLDNCCTLLLIFIIICLILTVIFFIVRCFFLEETVRDLRLQLRNCSLLSKYSKHSVSQAPTEKSFTFFPG